MKDFKNREVLQNAKEDGTVWALLIKDGKCSVKEFKVKDLVLVTSRTFITRSENSGLLLGELFGTQKEAKSRKSLLDKSVKADGS